MLKRPGIRDEQVAACLRDQYALKVDVVEFLPVGADRDAAAFRVVTASGLSYFAKLRRGHFDEISIALPRFLANQGIPHSVNSAC